MNYPKSPNQPNTRRILLVDDENGIRTVLSISLQDMGYTVSAAASAEEALAIMENTPFPIVLTDIKMPGKDGLELLTEIKTSWPETEVIMLTGHGDMDLAVRSLQLNAADFIAKPISDPAIEVALKRAQERIRLKLIIEEHTNHLEKLVEEKTQALIQSERMAAAGEAATSLSHTIKNIASGLEGCMFLLDQGIKQDHKEYIEQGWGMMKSSVTRISNLSADLLTHARATSLTLTPADPVSPVHTVATLIKPNAQDAGIDLRVIVPDSLPPCLLDADALERALLNLVDNALQAVIRKGKNGLVSISLKKLDNTLLYQVTDTGVGIPPAILEKLFTPFFTTKGLEGTGIGLAAAQKIANLHEGKISVQSEEGVGSTFTLTIPFQSISP